MMMWTAIYGDEAPGMNTSLQEVRALPQRCEKLGDMYAKRHIAGPWTAWARGCGKLRPHTCRRATRRLLKWLLVARQREGSRQGTVLRCLPEHTGLQLIPT